MLRSSSNPVFTSTMKDSALKWWGLFQRNPEIIGRGRRPAVHRGDSCLVLMSSHSRDDKVFFFCWLAFLWVSACVKRRRPHEEQIPFLICPCTMSMKSVRQERSPRVSQFVVFGRLTSSIVFGRPASENGVGPGFYFQMQLPVCLLCARTHN